MNKTILFKLLLLIGPLLFSWIFYQLVKIFFQLGNAFLEVSAPFPTYPYYSLALGFGVVLFLLSFTPLFKYFGLKGA